jgi:hypothetical protein
MVLDTRLYCGHEIDSDHYLVISAIQIIKTCDLEYSYCKIQDE